jgi:hypothetical protein
MCDDQWCVEEHTPLEIKGITSIYSQCSIKLDLLIVFCMSKLSSSMLDNLFLHSSYLSRFFLRTLFLCFVVFLSFGNVSRPMAPQLSARSVSINVIHMYETESKHI